MIPNHTNGHHRTPASIQLPTLRLHSGQALDFQPPVTAEEELSQAKLAEIWARRAYALAEPPPVETTGQTLEVLVCLLGGERYGLEVSHVREIYPPGHLTPVPRTPDFVVGVFSARGRLISVIDLSIFLGLPTSSARGGAESKIVVVTSEDLEVGLLTDEVADVLTIFKDTLEPALTSQVSSRAEFTQGIAPGMLVVLNLTALLSDKRLIVHEELL
ncbi:MAG: chemotaxis protein CheW [Anaerolineales bacterium]|nr:chemotaxis protein CheW [Anaerolineales bacterium]